MKYIPELYWSRVAYEILKRGEGNLIAGDDNPYFRYKRSKFLKKFLDTIDFQSKVILEVGPGPGGNLKHIADHHGPKKLYGGDVSQKMLEIAAKNLISYNNVELKKVDGVNLPYLSRSVDVSFTATVLQHNTDEIMCRSLVRELCRVTEATIVVMEDIGGSQALSFEASWIGRPVNVYESMFVEQGFQLSQVQFLNTRISRLWYKILGLYQRLSGKLHREGDAMGTVTKMFIGLPLPVTRILDEIFAEKQNLAKMVFHRQSQS